jgi:hypothetical protein
VNIQYQKEINKPIPSIRRKLVIYRKSKLLFPK